MKQKYLASACILGTFTSCALAYDLATDQTSAAWQASPDSRLQMLDARLTDKVNELLVLGELLSQHMTDARQQQNIAQYNQERPLLVGQDDTPQTSRLVVKAEPSAFEPTAPARLPERSSYRTSTQVNPAEPSSNKTITQGRPAELPPQQAAAHVAPTAPGTLVQTEPSSFKVQRIHTPGAAPAWEEYRLSMVVVSDAIHLAVINNQYVRRGDQLIPGITVTDISAKQVVLNRNDQTIQLTMADE